VKVLEDVLEVGLDCLIDKHLETPSGEVYSGYWVKLSKINSNFFIGTVEDIPELINFESEFNREDIKVLRGDIEWNINNLHVKVSEEILKGVSIGYFYNSFDQEPLSYGRSFYSINEIEKNKKSIPLFEVELWRLCDLEENLKDILLDFAYYGVIRDKDGGFSPLTKDDIIKKDRKVFPCFYEYEMD
jgi:hypothetical protein